ncbi:MAG: glycosyltransferase [Methanophagales archaeon]|nr:glycosyltransferase [Methanophagales archaeon]
MKILMVVASYSPSFGGPTTVIKALTNELVKRGHEVSIYTSDNFDGSSRVQESGKTVEIDGVKVSYFKNISNKLAYNHNIYISPMLVKEARNNLSNFDIIHFHGYRTIQNVIGHHYTKRYGIPYILQAHGSVLPLFQKQRLKKIFDIFFGYRMLRDASKVIALTKTEVEQYKKMGVDGDKIEIVPNGIDLSEYENLPTRGEFRKKYSIKNDEKIILYLGRIHKTKGIDLLVKAFADTSKELNNVRLVLVGPDDGYQSALEELIQSLKVDNKVLFTGFVSNDEKMAAFVDADVFITPSFSGFPVTFLEACACGTPIITTNNGDELDWIYDKVGYVVEYDKDQLRDAICKVLSDEGLRRIFGMEGKRLVRGEFGWEKIVRRLERIYEDMGIE